MADWFTYMVRCADLTLYTGVTTDLVRRLDEHNNGVTGAKYTRARRPVSLVYSESALDRSTACKREAEIKRMAASEKQRLIEHQHDEKCRSVLRPS